MSKVDGKGLKVWLALGASAALSVAQSRTGGHGR